ncbi:hypothetical protein SLEP1_g47108 [Rubroshorea leprosula]|uniref:non-specific serine/threonine protein kinase n=1 Tax=Rubroshorea leprosula TaxID=152421 RepID=A0AAV5LQ68_9ROSI|nr:hypothetical protein SLEP1_g47108 [Rubroshorea leprosula]
MVTTSPRPNSSPSAVPLPSNGSPQPPSTSAPLPQNSPPPQSPTPSPPQPSANPPGPSTRSPPPAATPPPPRRAIASPPPTSPPPSNPSSPAPAPAPALAPAPSNPAPPPPTPKPSPEPLPNSPPPSPAGNNPSSPPPTSQHKRPSSGKSSAPPSHVPDTPAVNNSHPGAESLNPSISDRDAVAIGIAVVIIVLCLIGLAVCCLRKRKRKLTRLNAAYVMPSPIGFSSRSDSFLIKMGSSAPIVGSSSGSNMSSPKGPGGLGNSRTWFTYEELVKATNGFSEHNLLGEGGFGGVYKGSLPDGREVAVKQLKIGGGQGEREFKAEVEIIHRIHHRHLVSLVGYCISENQRLLVYDYVPNNTLYFHLHGKGRPVLDWATRIKIAAGAARGIAYLHEDCHPRIIHRDIKSSNILLDKKFEARVSDFGLAKLALDTNTHITTRVMGTFGYIAPEYATCGKLSEKSDVFSFGVVLLELITGRKPVDTSQPLGDESLVEWARPLLTNALDTKEYGSLADPRLGGNYVESEMFRMVEAAAASVRHLAAKRPRMGQIVRALESLATVDLSNGMKVGESEAFNAARQSEEIRWFRRMAFSGQNYSTDCFSEYERVEA